MATKYSGYIHTPATRATGYVEDPNGSVVLARDYDALDEALNECIKDRDWFSDRLDAATAELARVKAESLRVVVDGEACYPGYTQAINCIYDGNLYSITGKCGGFVWLRPINSNDGGDFSISTSDTVQPVRLVAITDAEI